MNQQTSYQNEACEVQHLAGVQGTIREEQARLLELIESRQQDVRELKTYLSENKAGMDHVEKVGVRQAAEEAVRMGDHNLREYTRLSKLLNTTYFGKIDFSSQPKNGATPVYIGIHPFYDAHQKQHLVHDWRAPVSSMFYDFETGEAHYDAPSGRISGLISLKRQYRIEKGKLAFMLESSLNIHDDVLQKELSRASSEKRKTSSPPFSAIRMPSSATMPPTPSSFRGPPAQGKPPSPCTASLFCSIASRTVSVPVTS